MTKDKRNLDDILGRGRYQFIHRKTGVTRSHISRVLRGISGVSPEIVQKIASATSLTTDSVWSYIQMKRTLEGVTDEKS